MNDLAWVEPYRNDFLTIFFKMISYAGEELFLMVFLALGYWCINKKVFRDLTVLICVSTLINVFLKGIFQVARPLGEHLMAVNDVYSFPSGHAQVTTVFWLFLAMHYRQSFFWFLAGAVILGQCLSRVYLGVHFPTDVLAGSVVGSVLVVLYSFYKNSIYWQLFSRSKWAVALVFALFIGLYCFSDINKNNTIAGGALFGVILGHLLEHRFCDYIIPSNFLFKVSIGVFGLAALMGLELVLKAIAPAQQSLWYIFFMYTMLSMCIMYFVPVLAKKLNKF